MKLSIRYEGRPRPWARPQTYRTKRGGYVRVEDKTRHWSRKAFNAMTKLWIEAWLSSPERKAWDGSKPMALHLTAHFDGREGGHLVATLETLSERGCYTSAPDADNIVKLCMEAAQKAGVLKNDSQVVILVATKTKP